MPARRIRTHDVSERKVNAISPIMKIFPHNSHSAFLISHFSIFILHFNFPFLNFIRYRPEAEKRVNRRHLSGVRRGKERIR